MSSDMLDYVVCAGPLETDLRYSFGGCGFVLIYFVWKRSETSDGIFHLSVGYKYLLGSVCLVL